MGDVTFRRPVGVLLESWDGVGGGRKREVIDLARLYDGDNGEKVIGRESREVIDTISGVIGCKLNERG